jgi:quinol monooxygenase YgiN
MKRVIVRYKVKPDQVARNEELVRAVYAELASTDPGGLRYATFKLEDGVSFAHIAETEDGANPLAGVKAFKEFQKDIGARCDEPPVVTEMETIGSYRV